MWILGGKPNGHVLPRGGGVSKLTLITWYMDAPLAKTVKIGF